MATQTTDSDRVYDVAAGAIGQFLRVKTPGALVVAGLEACHGYTEYPILAAGGCTIALRNKVGTVKMTAAGIIAAGGICYAAAAGKVAATGTIVEGIARTAAGANNDIIEMIPANNYDISTAIAGTTNATFIVDTDTAAAKLKLDVNSCTGAFTMTVGLPASLGQDTFVTLPDPGGVAATVEYINIAQTVSAIKTHSADIILTDGTDLALGTSSVALLRFSAADASSPGVVLGLSDTNEQFHITDKAAIASDWNIADVVHPVVYIHSNTTPITDYLAIGAHDGTTCGVDVVGGTTFTIGIGGTPCATFIAGGVAPSALTLTGGIAGPTSTLTPFIPIGADAAAVAPTAAIPLTNYLSWLNAAGGNTTQTLAAGVVRGQVKRLQAIHANDDVVTVTGLSGGTTITFTNVGEYVVLLWTGAAWVIIESGNVLLGTNVGPAVA